MDRARKKTDNILMDLERRVSEVYLSDPSLLRIQKKYDKYMKGVARRTQKAYRAYIDEPFGNNRDLLKEAYREAVRANTIGSRKYQNLVAEFSSVLAETNQKALDLINDVMPEIYSINYNQISVDCRKVGIDVNG